MATAKARMKKLSELAQFFIENMKYGTSFKYYSGTNAHDEDYIEYDMYLNNYRFYHIADGIFNVECYSVIEGKRKVQTMNWEELAEFFQDLWN